MSPTSRPTSLFTKDDGTRIRIVPGFRERLLARPSTWPQPDWTAAEYGGAASTLVERWQRRTKQLAEWGVRLDGLRVLEIGCGAGLQSLLLGLSRVREVISTDLRLRVLDPHSTGDRSRRLAAAILPRAGWQDGLDSAFARLPIRFRVADATRLEFDSQSFDLVISGSVLEHVQPLHVALAELSRVLRPAGLMFHAVDPYYWLRGCHKAGMVDIPWAHARLSRREIARFVGETAGKAAAAAVVGKLDSLNRYTLQQYRDTFAAAPVQVVRWREERNTTAAALLEEFPEVLPTVLPGLSPRDLVHGQIQVLAARTAP